MAIVSARIIYCEHIKVILTRPDDSAPNDEPTTQVKYINVGIDHGEKKKKTI